MEAVLANIDAWFRTMIFVPLEAGDPATAIRSMFAEVTAYFRSGRCVCLVGWIGLGSSGTAFGGRIRDYFARWIAALAHCLQAGAVPPMQARTLAEEAVSGIQGAIVLARALNEDAAFGRIVSRHEAALLDVIADHAVAASQR